MFCGTDKCSVDVKACTVLQNFLLINEKNVPHELSTHLHLSFWHEEAHVHSLCIALLAPEKQKE